MRRICIFSLLASTVSSAAFAQSLQFGYSNSVIGQPYWRTMPAQQNYGVQPPHYVSPPHYVVQQASDAPTPSANASLPPAPWNSRGGGLFEGLFGGGPTVTAHVFRPFQPSYAYAPPPGAQAAYAPTDQSDSTDYPIDPKYLWQEVFYDGSEKPGMIIIDTPDKFLNSRHSA